MSIRMMMTDARRPALGLLLAAAAGAAFAQSEELPGSEETTAAAQEYRPLFTPEMIEAAEDPQQAERMRQTEERNRQAWEERQRAAQQQAPAAAAAQPAEAQPTTRRPARRKIYRWVDKDGNVNFGDAPGGHDATEVKVGGVARQRGRPAPPPNVTGGER